MPLPAEAEVIVEALASLFREAQAAVVDELVATATRVDSAGRLAIRMDRLREMERALDAELTQLTRQTEQWLSGQLPEVFRLGAEQGGLDFTWTATAREAVQALAADMHDDLLAATRYVRRDTKTFIREATRPATRAAVMQGQTAVQAGKALAERLRDRGIAAVTYRNGARHGIGEYGSMVVRTKSALAFNRGAFISARDNGVTWMECYDGPDCGLTYHGDSDLANGTIRPLAEAEAWPISHPNCARSWGPRPDVTDAKQAEGARRYTPDEQQRLAQQERERVARQNARKRTARPRPAQQQRQRTVEKRAARAAQRPAAVPKVQPQGVEARSALANVPSARTQIGPGVHHSLEQIEKVHRVPQGLATVPVKPSTARSYYGQYGYKGNGLPDAIRITTTGDHIAGTFTHEFGHYLDHQANLVGQVERFGTTGRAVWGTSPAGMQAPEMRALFDAIEATPTWAKLLEAKAQRASGASYYASKVEAWARSYHQWIATRTGSRTMLDELAVIRQAPGARGLSQWDPAEFGPIAGAFDALFRAKGLLIE